MYGRFGVYNKSEGMNCGSGGADTVLKVFYSLGEDGQSSYN